MTNEKMEKIAKWLLFASFFTPLIYVSGFYYPFVISKVLFFRLVIQVVFSIYIILLISDYKKYKPRINWGIIIVFGLLVSSFVSAVLGLDFYKSFWSSFERMEGVVSHIYIFVYLFLLLQFFREKKDWQNAIRAVIIAGFLGSIYAIVQRFNILPVFEAGTSRAAGTIGNAAFLAGYMLLCLGIAIYHYFQESNKNFKIFTLISLVLFGLTILLTSTRGAILGILVAIFWFLIIYIFWGEKKRKHYSIAILILLVFFSSLFYFFKNNFQDSNIDFVRRIATISIQDATVKNRLMVWDMAVSEFKNYPVFGVGMENFNVIYNKHFNPKINENWFDRTHNIYLDYLIHNGLLGLILYLFLLVYIFVLLFKRRKEEPILFFSISSLMIAYGVHNFFVFDVLSTSLLFIFIFGFLGFVERERVGDLSNEKISEALQIVVVLFLLVANIFLFYKLIYQPYSINKNLYTAYYYILADPELSYDRFEASLKYKYGSAEGAVQLAQMYNVLDDQGEKINYNLKNKFQKLAEEKLNFAIENFPLDVRLRLHLGQFLINYNQSEDALVLAKEQLEKSIELGSQRLDAYYILFNLYLIKNDYESAVKIIDQLVEEIPWYGQAKLIALGPLLQVDPEKAERYFEEGVSQSGVDRLTIKNVLEYLVSTEQYEESIPYYLKFIEFYPNRYDYRIDLAKIYYLAGNIDGAIEQVNIINAHNPLLLENEAELIQSLSFY